MILNSVVSISKTLGTLAMIASLGACTTIDMLKSEPIADNKRENITRALVEKSNVAMIKVNFGDADQYGKHFIASSGNNGTAVYGKAGRGFFTLRGGLIVETRGLGNDLLGVRPNANDPTMNARAPQNWPASITREYRLFGDGVNGRMVRVTCDITPVGTERIVILEHAHNTQIMRERCVGDGYEFENKFWVAANGYIWKSIQWVGENDIQPTIEVVEPLD